MSSSPDRVHELAAIVESSNDAIVGMALDGTITSWNPAAERLYGYTEAEAVGGSIERLEPEERRGEVRDLLARVAAGERIASLETVHVRKDGSRVDVLSTTSPIRDDRGAVAGASAITHALAASRQLFDRHPAPLWIDEPGTFRLLAANDATVALTGYSRDELLALESGDLLQGRGEDGLWELRRRDGRRRDVAVLTASLDFHGRPARLVLVQDETDRLEAEEELHRVERMEAIGRITGSLAHDFSNLLMVIRGHSQLLLTRLDGADGDAVRQIAESAERAAELTRQVLSFARRQSLRADPLDLTEVVERALPKLERVAGARVQLLRRLEPVLPPVRGDRRELTRALLHLAQNACEAMPEGGTLELCTSSARLGPEHAVPSRTYVCLQVTDAGAGMDADTRARAFDPFFTTKVDAAGLGLAAVHALVKQSGGATWLYSEPGVGTSVKLYFPAAVSAPGPPEAEAPAGDAVILAVERDDLLRDLVVRTLEPRGYTVLPAATPDEAVAVAERFDGPIDVLVTEAIEGRRLAQRLEQSKVIYTSGFPAETLQRLGIADGRAPLVEKPFLVDDLTRALHTVLGR